MNDILMTIACALAIGSAWLTYSNSIAAENIRYRMFKQYAHILKKFSK